MNISEWIGQNSSDLHFIYIKRLSANDTGQNKNHQVGIYIPHSVSEIALSPICSIDTKNPDMQLIARIESHEMPPQIVRAIYYNSKKSEKKSNGRNEKRITRWNTDISDSPLQDGDNTGALTLFSFEIDPDKGFSESVNVWVSRNIEEEEFVEGLVGEVYPGEWLSNRGDLIFNGFSPLNVSVKSKIKLPDEWKSRFPSGGELIDYLAANYQFKKVTPDDLILERREQEFKLFLAVEELHVMDKISSGFSSVDEFISLANSISNRRKSRSGKSLELHLEFIFKQFGITSFSTQCVTEQNKRPDFIFPSCEAYHRNDIDSESLKMLAVKTTCKDRWRQIINEAERIKTKHLFTLQEGVSVNQFNEMRSENVILVVPEELKKKYPEEIREHLLSLNDFIHSVIALQ